MILTLIGTGVTLGIVHVLTGPDHLSALATLSANVNSRKAFFLGVRWGVGHSTGLLTVGIVFILISLSSSTETVHVPDGVSHFFESIVGIFMILLGIYGIRRAHYRKNTELSGRDGLILVAGQDDASIIRSRTEEGFAEEDEEDDEETECYETFAGTEQYTQSYHTHAHQASFSIVDENLEVESQPLDTIPSNRWQACTSKITTGMMALLVGIIHGLAGPGGVLGVIPAVQMHDAKLAAVYLGCFCVSSTMTMGVFAVLYGTFTMKLGRRLNSEFLVELISASFSILVGIMWIVLLSIGKLDDIFP